MQAVTNLDSYLEKYGALLGRQAQDALNPLHIPGRDQPLKLDLKQPLYHAQAHCAMAGVKQLNRDRTVWYSAAIGSGKTRIATATCQGHSQGNPYHALVMAPGHLTRKWAREIRLILRNVDVVPIDRWTDIVGVRDIGKPIRPTWWIIGRDRAKLGAKWKSAYIKRRDGMPCCPKCGAPILDDKGLPIPYAQLMRRKHWCEAEAILPASGMLKGDAAGEPIKCGEPLWTYTHELDRWEPALYIKNHLPGFFKYFVLDEAHEERSPVSAQGQALGSIAAACEYSLLLTGSLCGGLAEHLRPLLFRTAPRSLVKDGFSWSEVMPFSELYGRIETRVVEKDGGDDDNSQSRGSKTTKTKHVRPGIMPTLFGNHLIDKCIFLSLDQVADNLPKYSEKVVGCHLDAEQRAAYDEVEQALRDEIRSMIARGDKRLLGAMLHTLLGYPDRPYGWETIGYYDRDRTFHEVVTPPDLNKDTIRPKERALLDMLKAEAAERRQVWVYCQMTDKRDVMERLETLIKAEGLRVKVMRASVPVAEREAWIEKHGRDVDVMLSNPVLVQTGLELFDYNGRHNFCTIAWYQETYQPFVLRQAGGRSYRLGQKKECRVFYFYYANTMQARLMTLMGRKLSASMALEGKFSSEGLNAMAGEESSVEMALAKSLAEKLDDLDAELAWQKLSDQTSGSAWMEADVKPPEPAPKSKAKARYAPIRSKPVSLAG